VVLLQHPMPMLLLSPFLPALLLDADSGPHLAERLRGTAALSDLLRTRDASSLSRLARLTDGIVSQVARGLMALAGFSGQAGADPVARAHAESLQSG
jgi:hypothetical protein